MALNIKDPETDRLVRRLADVTGESITSAVEIAVRERLERVQGVSRRDRVFEDLNEISRRCAALPVLDDRPADELVGYDEDGLPA